VIDSLIGEGLVIDWTSLAIVFGTALGIVWTVVHRHRSSEYNDMMLRQSKEALMLAKAISERIDKNGNKVASSLGMANGTGNSNSDE
jgi:hypothetical protein